MKLHKHTYTRLHSGSALGVSNVIQAVCSQCNAKDYLFWNSNDNISFGR